jgi:hypothetical protein
MGVEASFPWSSVVGALILGSIGLWSGTRIWQGKSIRPWVGRKGFRYPVWYASATLLPGGLFIGSAIAVLAGGPADSKTLALEVIFRAVVVLAIIVALTCAVIGLWILVSHEVPNCLRPPIQ